MIGDMNQPAQLQDSQQNIGSKFSQPVVNWLHSGVAGRALDKKNVKSEQVSELERLDLLEKVLDDIDAKQATPLQISKDKSADQFANVDSFDQRNARDQDMSYVSAGRKEASEGGLGSSQEQAAAIQYVEEEKSPELPIEVEKYIKEVKTDQEKAPKEIVIAQAVDSMPDDDQYVSERVVVLPITPEIEKKGRRKSPKFSIRWLVEWSKKIMKIFEGKVIYRPAVSK